MARLAAWFAVILCVAAAVRVGADASVDKSLTRQRTTAAAAAYALAETRYKTGMESIETVYRWSVRWLESQRDAKGALPAAAAAAHQQRMQALEADAKARVASGVTTPFDTTSAEFYRIEAELWAQR
jgi:hypothetical protein